MAFTEFCCRSGGSNLNAGTRTGNSTEPGTGAALTYASGSWVSATRVFTVASGNPTNDGVAVGDFASVYPDAATVAVFIGRVTARDATTITISGTAKSGTSPVDGTNNTTLKIGGAWLGPNGADVFPFGFIATGMTNAAGNTPRVNFKNDATYSISASAAHSLTGPLTWQGYTTTYGDLGRSTIDGGANAIVLVSITGNQHTVLDTIVSNNGASGSNAGLSLLGSRIIVGRCVVHDVRGHGFALSGSDIAFECEAYACNGSNTASTAGFSSGATLLRCISHDNTGTNATGFINGSSYIDCIADSNGFHGFRLSSNNVQIYFSNCDAYNNGVSATAHGFECGGNGSDIYIENSNCIKNSGYGIDVANANQVVVVNCGFGSGTAANTSGPTNYGAAASSTEIGSVTYVANITPWVDPANGDFRINLAAAEGTGRGTFTETAASYTGTIGYPDIGAAQHLDSGGGGHVVGGGT